MSSWIEKDERYYMPVARRQPIVITRGLGTTVWDENDVQYLDFTSGWAVNNIGHCNPVLVEAIRKQAGTLIQTSNQFYTVPQLELAEFLTQNSCLDKVFFCNSGAEANEGAIKLARKFGKLNLDGAYEIIATVNSFHGRTLTTAAATGNVHYQENFTPMPPGFIHVEYNNIEALQNATNKNTCAVILEPVQGEGGVIIPDGQYLKRVRELCDEKGILLILDEVQTGMGRLGALFGYQRFDIEPDVMTLAKGLGGGVPIGAFLSKSHCDVLRPGDHGSTFGGNPLTCAASFAVANFIVEQGIPEKVLESERILMDGLEAIKARHETLIKEVRGMGLLLAVEFYEDIGPQIVSISNDNGLLLNPVRPNVVRFMPPLTVSETEIGEAVDRFGKAVDSLSTK